MALIIDWKRHPGNLTIGEYRKVPLSVGGDI